MKMHRTILPVFFLTTLMLGTSCSSDSVVDEPDVPVQESADPMRFTCNVQENISSTRAAYLKDDFIVSTYKSYKLSDQQTVMDKYRVNHTTTGTDWDGNVQDNWNYVGVDGQIERFWDYSSFPYRFNAVAPYPADKSKIVLSDAQLEINAPYKMQTLADGVKTNPVDRDAEPFWLAQVQRATDGKDKDIIADSEIINSSSSTTLNRYVALPFHHLNSKVRFAIYTTSPWATAHPMYIENLSLKVVSADFVSGAGKYTASGDSWYIGTGTSGFTDLTKATSTGTELLHYSGVDADNKPLAGNDLSKWQSKATAFWFECKEGLMQIPQDGVKMTLSMNLYLLDGEDVLQLPLQDVPVKLSIEGETPTEYHQWKSGYIYTYYLVLENVGEKLEITFTATLTPWEDLSGSLETDLEQ